MSDPATPAQIPLPPGPWEWGQLDDGTITIKSVVNGREIAEIAYDGDENAQRALADAVCTLPECLDAMRDALKLCRCRGTGSYATSCTLCGDSTFDHYCNDRTVPCDDKRCIRLRAAIAKATGGGA